MDFFNSTLRVILTSILTPLVFLLIAYFVKKEKSKKNNETDVDFIIKLPQAHTNFGYFAIILFVVVLTVLAFSEISKGLKPHPGMFICFGLFILLAIFETVQSKMFAIYVKDSNIKVKTMFRRKYTFTFDDIVSVTKKAQNRYKAYGDTDRITIRTSDRKIVIKNSMLNYERMVKLLKTSLPADKFIGFE